MILISAKKDPSHHETYYCPQSPARLLLAHAEMRNVPLTSVFLGQYRRNQRLARGSNGRLPRMRLLLFYYYYSISVILSVIDVICRLSHDAPAHHSLASTYYMVIDPVHGVWRPTPRYPRKTSLQHLDEDSDSYRMVVCTSSVVWRSL